MTLSSVTMKSWKKVMCNFRHCSLNFKGILPYDHLPRTCGPTNVFTLCKLPKRSNGKDLPCYITYHCLKMEIIDLTGVNIENEWFKPPPSHSDICVFYLTGGRREKKIYLFILWDKDASHELRCHVKTKSCCDFNVLIWGCGGALMRWEWVMSWQQVTQTTLNHLLS